MGCSFLCRNNFNPSTAYGGPLPDRCPSPLSLCDISPHCGESPFTREAKK